MPLILDVSGGKISHDVQVEHIVTHANKDGTLGRIEECL